MGDHQYCWLNSASYFPSERKNHQILLHKEPAFRKQAQSVKTSPTSVPSAHLRNTLSI